ncbi:MAG: hypothetical protein IPI04_09010 [Ignavibacteria bacterium]|nr:hypothetical protein [Ignavibacteria bacterium]
MENDTNSGNTYHKIKPLIRRTGSVKISITKDSGSRAWILHRISGIALVAYLFLHIYSISPLT